MLNRPFARYLLAAVAVLVALVWRLAMVRALHAELPTYITFYPAVIFAAVLAGQSAGLVATALSALAVDYWVLPPVGSFAIANPAEAVGLALFCLMGAVISVLAERYRRNRERRAAVEKELALFASKAALAESEQRWETTLRSIGDAVIAVDARGHITFMNQLAQSLTGWNEREAGGRPASEIFRIEHEQTGEALECPITGVMRLNQVVQMANHAVVISRGGNRIPVEDSAAPIRDANGKLNGAVLVFRDVTERRVRQREREQLLQALQRQADMLRLSFDAIVVWRLDGGIESWNLGAELLYGFSENEAMGRVTHELLHTVHPKPLPQVEAELREKGFWEGELRHFTEDGRELIVSARKQLMGGADGIKRVLEVNRDITERKQAEIESRAREQRLRLATDAAQLGIFEWTVPTNTVVWENQRMYEIFGIPETTDAVNRDRFVRETLHPEDLQRFNQELEESMQPGALFRGAYRICSVNDGQWRWIQYFSKFELTPDGKPLRLLGVLEDITERKRAEEERETTIEFLRLVNQSRDTRDLIQRATVFFQQRSACEAVGIRLRQGKDYPYFEYRGFSKEFVQAENMLCTKDASGLGGVDGSGNPVLDCMCGNVICGRFDPSKPFFTAKGSFWANDTTRLLATTTDADRQARTRNRCNGEGYESVALIALRAGEQTLGLLQLNDKRKGRFSPESILSWERLAGYLSTALSKFQAEEALRLSEERWATTLRSIGDAVISTDAAGKIMFMNDVAQNLTGWPIAEAHGKDLPSVFNIINEETRKTPESPVSSVLRLGQIVGLANHTVLIGRDGIEYPIEDSAAPIRNKDGEITGVVLVFHDVSEKRKAEKAVRDSERLAITGRLAASLAHEIHNPLDTVGNLLYLIEQSSDPETTRGFVELAAQELARVTQMTRHMLSFQRESTKPVPVNIVEILDSVVALFERKIEAAGIQIEKRVCFEQEFLALPSEIRQVFANLFGNAVEAVAHNGKIKLCACASRNWRTGERGLRVTVADNGPGIPAAIRGRVLEPFFTTKGESGTGLGLWITSGIIEKNGGTLRLRTVTREGRTGTCFSAFFPIG